MYDTAMTRLLALAFGVLVIVPGCKKDEKKQADAPKEEMGKGGGGGGGGGKGDGTGGGKGDGTGGGDGKHDDGKCPALEITVDGAPLEGMTHGQAVTVINPPYTIHMVNLYNREAPCESPPSMARQPAEGEIYAKAWFSDMPGVGIDAYTEVPMKPNIKVTKETKTVGEPFEICVFEPVAFTPTAGAYTDKKVVMKGLFTGTFCGEIKQ